MNTAVLSKKKYLSDFDKIDMAWGLGQSISETTQQNFKEGEMNWWQVMRWPRLIDIRSELKLSCQVWVTKRATVAQIVDSFNQGK